MRRLAIWIPYLGTPIHVAYAKGQRRGQRMRFPSDSPSERNHPYFPKKYTNVNGY
jgi:hypothetical protein